MELSAIRTKTLDLIKKYKFVVIILLVGLGLMLIPAGGKQKKADTSSNIQKASEPSVDVALAEILSKIDGAGDVQVFLSIAAGEETVYQTDKNSSASESSNTTKNDTIIVTDSDRNQSGLIKQVIPPRYQGAIILCDGADSASVRLAIADAVSKVTGLSYDHISVLKMK